MKTLHLIGMIICLISAVLASAFGETGWVLYNLFFAGLNFHFYNQKV